MGKITRREVQEASDALASEAWELREIPGELERIEEIRTLVRQQLADDVYSIRGGTGSGRTAMERVGREYVGHHGMTGRGNEPTFGESLWPARTPDQVALAEGMEPFYDGLPGEMRAIVDWHFGGMLDQHQISKITGLSQPTVHRRIKAAIEELRRVLSAAFLSEPREVTE